MGSCLYIQFVGIAIFMSLHGPAGACIPVASVSLIHVPPIQRVLKHCGAYIHNIIYNIYYTHTHVIQNTPAAKPASWGVKRATTF